tara:strand:+ start:531 stop:1247 length:717 start_codon:yes stop_codon:yes gene_type:complete
MRTFGLIGKKLNHSFSSKYFNTKFLKEGISDAQYINFEINDISKIRDLIKENKITGLNITIPYKESVVPFLDELSTSAKNISTVNTIQVKKNKLIGHNTDVIGFKTSLSSTKEKYDSAIILGNGGGAKAVQEVLKQLNISFKIVSRNSSFDFVDLSSEDIKNNKLIINTTPLGMFPKTNNFPNIPYDSLTENHFLFDLIYNPKETLFLKYGRLHQSQTKNGLEMLQIQAKESWNIWNT